MGNYTATVYIPDENGWLSNEYYYCRFKVEQSYNSLANRSSFTVTPQFKMSAGSYGSTVTDGAVTADGNSLVSFASLRYRANFSSGSWTDITALYAGDPTGWIFSKEHNADGSCSVVFGNTINAGNAVYNSSSTKSFTGDARTYTLTITADGNSQVTVTDGVVQVYDGGAVAHGDTLTVIVTASSGYQLKTFTINGTAKTSPASHTVSGPVAIVAESEAQGLVYIRRSGAWAAHRCFIRRNGAWVQHRPYIYHNGAWTLYG